MITFSIFSVAIILIIVGCIMQLFTINSKLDKLLYRTRKRRKQVVSNNESEV